MKSTKQKSRRRPKRFVQTNNLVPCIIAVLFYYGPSALETVRSFEPTAYMPQAMLTPFGKMKRPYGLTPAMFNDYILACEEAKVSPQRISQTIGNAKASAGFHALDGTETECDTRGCAKYDYGAALDLGTRDLNRYQIKKLLSALADHGYFGWYRDWKGNRHIHVVAAGKRMKRALRDQFHDWANDRNGLVGHARETFHLGTKQQKNALRTAFFKFNPVRN